MIADGSGDRVGSTPRSRAAARSRPRRRRGAQLFRLGRVVFEVCGRFQGAPFSRLIVSAGFSKARYARLRTRGHADRRGFRRRPVIPGGLARIKRFSSARDSVVHDLSNDAAGGVAAAVGGGTADCGPEVIGIDGAAVDGPLCPFLTGFKSGDGAGAAGFARSVIPSPPPEPWGRAGAVLRTWAQASSL